MAEIDDFEPRAPNSSKISPAKTIPLKFISPVFCNGVSWVCLEAKICTSLMKLDSLINSSWVYFLEWLRREGFFSSLPGYYAQFCEEVK